jgi:hypothetical protein
MVVLLVVPSLKQICLKIKYILSEAKKMTTTIVNQIAELLLPLIRSDAQVTRTHIQILQDQLRSLLASQLVLVPDALIHCLSDIVIRRRTQRTIRLPNAINREISRYLSIPDAERYLVETDLPSGQIKDQVAKRWEQREKEYPNLIKDGKYSSWEALIREEYKQGRTLKKLIPFITAQNIRFKYDRSVLLTDLIREEHKKGRMSFEELIRFIPAQNIPYEVILSKLWTDLIREEYKKGRTLDKLIPFITAQNIPSEVIRSELWTDLIREEYKKGRMSFEELIPLITAQNIPYEEIRSKLWTDLIWEEYKKGRMSFEELIPFITAQNIPDGVIRSKLWTDLIKEEPKKGRTLEELIPFITAQNIPYRSIRSVLREILRGGIKRK